MDHSDKKMDGPQLREVLAQGAEGLHGGLKSRGGQMHTIRGTKTALSRAHAQAHTHTLVSRGG